MHHQVMLESAFVCILLRLYQCTTVKLLAKNPHKLSKSIGKLDTYYCR